MKEDDWVNIPVVDSGFQYVYNIALQSLGLLVYSMFLIWTFYNIVTILILKKRYKDFFCLLYYIFFVGLFCSRIALQLFEFPYIYSSTIKKSIIAADCFSVCIGLS